MQERYSEQVVRLSQPPSMTGEYAIYGGETVDGDAAWDLFCAAADGHVPTIEQLLADDPRLVHAQHWYSIPLRFAVLSGQVDAVQALLAAGSEPGMLEAGLFDWETFLQDSERRGFDDVLQVLLVEMKKRYGAEPYNKDFIALRKAIEDRKFTQAYERLKEYPELVHISDVRGNSALHLAASACSIELVDACLDLGSNIDARNYEATFPFDLGNEEIRRHLLKRGATYDFYGACSLGDEKRVDEYLSDDAGLAKQLFRSFNSPLMVGAKNGHLNIVTKLLDHCADPNLEEQQFECGGGLFAACACGHYEIAKLLLEKGADPNGPCESSGTSADHAATDEISKLLIEHGSTGRWSEPSGKPEDIREKILGGRKQRGENGFDPLLAKVIWSDDSELLTLYVEKFGSGGLKKLFPGSGPGGWFVPKNCSGAFLDQLIAAGFDVNRPSWVGRTHLHFLSSRNHLEAAQHFIQRGADMNFVSLESGTTPLGSAAQQGHRSMVEFLLDQGADPSIPRDRTELQPRALAEQRGHAEVAGILRSESESR